jgi:hypothetical protein
MTKALHTMLERISLMSMLMLLYLTVYSQEAPIQFTIEQLREDLLFLRHKMETKNVNLYLYTPKKTMDSVFDALYAGINRPMTATEFYFHITAMEPYVKDGHNYLLPSKALQKQYVEQALYFPVNFIEYAGKIYITQNFSENSNLETGDEIMTINGEKAMDVFNKLVAHQVRDGDNLLYPKYLSQTYFRSYYGFLYGFPPLYKLEIKKAGEEKKAVSINALPLAVIKQKRKLVANPRYDRTNFDTAISWQIHTAQSCALLQIRTWSNDILRSDYGERFKQSIDAFMEVLKAAEPQNLLIDLRGNQGGDGGNGIYLLRYLLNTPFKYFYSVKAYKNNMQLKDAAPALTKTNYPMDYVFKGDVYVLTDGGSFSNSAIFASLIQFYKRGKIVGGETGGNGVVLSGGAGYFEAPNTGVNLLKITNQMITGNGEVNRQGSVKPDIVIQPGLPEILNNDDVVLKKLVDMIERKQPGN